MVINKKYVTEDNDYGICVSVTNSDSMKISNYCSTNCNNIPCYDLTCRNQGRCRKKLDGYNKYYYYCQCSDGFSGFDCSQKTIKSINSVICGGVNNVPCKEEPQRILSRQKRATFCVSNPCQNGGICSEGASNFNCTCLNGFKGTTCSEIDCAKSQCKFGSTCNATTSKCDCVTGFQGTLCEIKTDLCAPTNPCQNGVKCYDLLNDYECVDNLTIRKYGGDKNASMALTGCNANPCQAPPKTLCQPIFNGTTHSYTCMCPPGLTDDNCKTETTYQVTNINFVELVFDAKTKVTHSLSILTNDDEGVIFIIKFNDDPLLMTLEIANHGLQVSTKSETKMLYPANSITKDRTTFVPYQIILQINSLSLSNIICLYVRIENLNQAHFCSVYSKTTMSGSFIFGKKSELIQGNTMRPIEACFRDFQIDGVPANQITAPKSCFTINSCKSDSCNINNGKGEKCIDYLMTKKCVCRPGYFGKDCEKDENIYIVTNKQNSYVQYDYTSTLKDLLSKNNQLSISLFLTTRSINGILTYIGSFPTADFNSMTFLAIEITNGYLTLISKIPGQSTMDKKLFAKTLAWKFNDGQMKFISLSLDSQSNINILFNSHELNETFVSFTDSQSQQFSNNFVPSFIGGLDEIDIVWFGQPASTVNAAVAPSNNLVILPNNAVSSTSAFPTNIFTNSSSIVAMFRNIQINGLKDTLDTTVAEKLTIKSRPGVLIGLTTPETCNPNTCSNSISCTMDIFGVKRCTCTSGYIGDNCQFVDMCVSSNKCLGGQNCLSRPFGYDCNSIFSFTKPNKSIQIGVGDKSIPFSRFSIRMRTRATNSVLLSVISSQTRAVMSIDAQGKLTGKMMDSNNKELATGVVTSISINDANWHTVQFVFAPALQITLDNLINRASDYGVVVLAPVTNVNSVTLGDSSNSFLGCIDQPMLNDFMLPISTVQNSTLSSNVILSDVGVSGSCNGSDVCNPSPCLNNATACNDDFNRFKCVCAANYEGERCQIATCAALPPCVNNRTGCSQICPLNTNNSVCTSNPNQPVYGCLCNPGWTGPLCNFTDPCAASPSPCKNNGVCQTQYTVSNNSAQFSCNCGSGWSGPTCEITTQVLNGLSSAAVAGIVVGVLLFILLAAILYWIYKRYQFNKNYEPQTEEATNQNNVVQLDEVLHQPNPEKLI